ncbi:MAG: helix-turn-helix transcriptional regulator [Methyloprofundus sp.]|nr:helix-turn-helix transcriptional regulator [Methyloprofundus sp.]
MKKRLNTNKVNEAMTTAGLTQTALAEALDVSKEAVSQWLKEKTYPRPNKVLQLGKLLNLNFDELVINEDPYTPVVAFRKMKGTKTKDHHIEKAQEMGRFLRHLVPFLPFDTLEMPPVLKKPSCDYDYLQTVAAKVRAEINVDADATIDFSHLIRRFFELQAVVVPVLWGSKQRHENAVHIYLPDSQSTWVYLNLDVNIHDFKFWMAHELGHCLSPSLAGDEAEDFADSFASALLFPEVKAKQAYLQLNNQSNLYKKCLCLLDIARQEVISPNTVMMQVNHYAKHIGKAEQDFGKTVWGMISNFNKEYKNVSEALLGDLEVLKAHDFIKKTEQSFETPFFNVLEKYLKESNKGPGIVNAITDMPLLDAWSMHAELT